MAIIKQAKNFRIRTLNKDVLVASKLIINTSKIMTFDATENNLEFNSNKKIKADGRG